MLSFPTNCLYQKCQTNLLIVSSTAHSNISQLLSFSPHCIFVSISAKVFKNPIFYITFSPFASPTHVQTNSLKSVKTQLPYDYYSLPFCIPEASKLVDSKENLGEILTGSRISNTLYDIRFLKSETCATLGANSVEELGMAIARPPWGRGAKPDKTEDVPLECSKMYSEEDMDTFAQFIEDKYKVNWLLDNMPAAQPKIKINDVERYSIGFDLGYVHDGMVYLNNHASIAIRYTESQKDEEGVQQYRIVGFEVKPSSVDYGDQQPSDVGCSGQPLVVKPHGDKPKRITWTYSVTWVHDTTSWSTRWERYFAPVDTQIHWFSIVNSILVIFFLSGMVAMILLRTLHADFRRYSQQIEAQDDIDEKGWKLVYGDVFRTPRYTKLLSVLAGFGVQMLLTCAVVLVFAVLGFLSPANRGSLLTALVVLVFLMGAAAGYVGMRVYKLFKGTAWKAQTLLNALLIPGMIFAIFIFINLCLWGAKSSAAIPFTTLLGLFGLWGGVSVPLVFVGSFFGYRRDAPKAPVGVNPIPRMIPTRPWYLRPAAHVLMGGVLPFGAVFIELFFVLSAVWGQKLHYIFTFLLIVFVILIITCGEIAVVMCYFQLCAEDYHWWWRSFLTSGATAIYFFAYSVFYFITKLKMRSFVSLVMYFGYTSILSIVVFVVTGCVGFFACYKFVTKLYSSIPFE